MTKTYRDIAKHTAVYGVGQILSRLASLLLLPLYTRCLSPADYGTVAVLDVTAGILGVLIGLGMSLAVNRYHFEADSEHERSRVWWTGFGFVTLMATVIAGPMWLGREALAWLTLGPEVTDGARYYTLALATLWLTTVGELPDTYLRVRKWSGLYVSISQFRLVLNVGLNVYFLVVLKMGIPGLLLGNLLTNLIVTTGLSLIMARCLGPVSLSLDITFKLWRFGAPLVVTSLMAMFMHEANRYFLRTFLDLGQVGVYSLAYKIGQGVNTMCLMPFTAIWSVAVYEIAKQRDAKQVYANVFKYFVYALLLVVFGISLLAQPLVSLIAPPEYAEAAGVIPIVLLAFVFFSLHNHFRVPALLAKRTLTTIPAFAAGVIVNAAGNMALIPWLGIYGAAVASIFTYAAFSGVGLLIYRRIDQYPYPFGECGAVLVGMGATYAAFRYGCSDYLAPWSAPLVAAAIFAAWGVVLFGPLGKQLLAARNPAVGPTVFYQADQKS